MRIKICGLTRPADAEMAIAAGADALGFNGWQGSRRFLDLAAARDWIAALPPCACRVAVLVDPDRRRVADVAALGCFHAVQLHGDEPPELCAWTRSLGIGVIRAFRLDPAGAPPIPNHYPGMDLLLDGPAGRAFGGSGKVADWTAARRLVEAHPLRRFWLAGGLTAANVRAAILEVRPHAVDVAGGVEQEPGRKDPDLVRRFIEEAKSAGASVRGDVGIRGL